MPSEEWSAGYRAGVAHAWAKPRRSGGLWAAPSDRDVDAPEGASEDFLDGWRHGLAARH